MRYVNKMDDFGHGRKLALKDTVVNGDANPYAIINTLHITVLRPGESMAIYKEYQTYMLKIDGQCGGYTTLNHLLVPLARLF